jgi:hypothetical protein
LSSLVGFDPSAIQQVLAVRAHQVARGKATVYGLVSKYLTSIEQVTAAVDKALGPGSK